MRPLYRALLRIILFPWLFWWFFGWLTNFLRLRFRCYGVASRLISKTVQVLLFILMGLPLIILITGEILIHANEWMVGEKAVYSFHFDPIEWVTKSTLEIPGPKYTEIPPPSPTKTESYDDFLLAKYAPVILQKTSHHPEWDIPVFIDFDGNDDPRDNINNEPAFRPIIAGLHAEVTAETEDSFYLLYCVYHIKDYDHPIREFISDWTFHDNDNEGIMFRVDKKLMQITEAEGWFHNRFFLANLTGRSAGSEPIQGKIFFENETHPLVYGQSMGHGVRCFQRDDMADLSSNLKILRFSHSPTPIQVNRQVEINGTYGFKSFDRWYQEALGPFGSRGLGKNMFEETFTIGTYPDGRKIRIGRFIAGIDFAKLSWSRPKPPWSWDDGWDHVPILIWHFYPSRAFESHFGLLLSHKYLRNRPVDQTFHMPPEELYKHLSLRGAHRRGRKWAGMTRLEQAPSRRQYYEVFQILLKKYVNRLFNALG